MPLVQRYLTFCLERSTFCARRGSYRQSGRRTEAPASSSADNFPVESIAADFTSSGATYLKERQA